MKTSGVFLLAVAFIATLFSNSKAEYTLEWVIVQEDKVLTKASAVYEDNEYSENSDIVYGIFATLSPTTAAASLMDFDLDTGGEVPRRVLPGHGENMGIFGTPGWKEPGSPMRTLFEEAEEMALSMTESPALHDIQLKPLKGALLNRAVLDPLEEAYAEDEKLPGEGEGYDDDDDDDDDELSSNGSRFAFQICPHSFGFIVTRLSDSHPMFDSCWNGGDRRALKFGKQYREITSVIPINSEVYGLGERIGPFALTDGVYNIWSNDRGTPSGPGLYGSQPMALLHADSIGSWGMFLLNAHAMDVTISRKGDGETPFMRWATIGGAFEFYFYTGPQPEMVVTAHHRLIGAPAMLPAWSLGYHQCNWGYMDVNDLRRIQNGMAKANMPMDVIWSDIDYMDEFKVFTYNEGFGKNEMRDWLRATHKANQRYVIIMDPGVATVKDYPIYDAGSDFDIWMKNGYDNKPYHGIVWPGDVVFPDFSLQTARDLWAAWIAQFHATWAPFDGLWIDMNEPANFCNGYCSGEEWALAEAAEKDAGSESGFYPNHPPYQPGDKHLDDHGVPLDLKVNDGYETMYNYHSLYPFDEIVATRQGLLDITTEERPFILTRSTFPGSQRYGTHWLGDNASTWKAMKESVSSVLSMTVYGFPYVGPDTCGFFGEPDEELCTRWMQLGAWYPFYRNHNEENSGDQEPFQWAEEAQLRMRFAMRERYKLMPTWYTLIHRAAYHGGTVWRPMFFQFPEEFDKLATVDQQFMFGRKLMVVPVLQKGASSVTAYFPKGRWYNYWDLQRVSHRGWVDLPVTMDNIPVFMLGGTVLFKQGDGTQMTVPEGRTKAMHVVVGLDTFGKARGILYNDDGVALDPHDARTAVFVTVAPRNHLLPEQGGGLTSTAHFNSYDWGKVRCSTITIAGVSNARSVEFNGDKLIPEDHWTFNEPEQLLLIDLWRVFSDGRGAPLDEDWNLQWYA